MKKLQLLLGVGLACGSCDGIPKDPEHTLERVRAERQYRVGIIAAGEPIGADRQRLFLAQVSKAAHASPVISMGAAEPLLSRLQEGKLDLVIGPMAPKTPWSKQVTVLRPLGEQVDRDGHVHLAALARKGENAWISLLDGEATKVAAAR